MTSIKAASTRSLIFDMVKERFGSLAMWRRIEGDIMLHCTRITDVVTDEQKKNLITQLLNIKQQLKEEGVAEDDLLFLDEEIERQQKEKQLSLYEEEDDSLDDEMIGKYANRSKKTEGIVGIHYAYNYSQLTKLTNGVYKQTKLVKFFISREKIIYGKIIAEMFDHPQKIPVATVIQSKKKDDDGKPVYLGVKLFGQKFRRTEYDVVKPVDVPFHIYRFITEHNQEMILMSLQRQEIGDYIVTGVIVECEDNKILTESSRLPTRLPFFFSQQIRNRIVKYDNHDEFRKKIGELGLNKTKTYEFPFTITKNENQYILKHPDWYKRMIWAWLLHSGKGIFNNYPLHIMQVGPKHSGKSLLLNGLHSRSKENRDIFSGSSSTMKNLVPSFKYKPAQLGYLAESNRFAFLDEFLRCLTHTHTSSSHGSQREEAVAMMNDLLEHQKREAGSGVSRVNVNMTSRVFATTNPIKGVRSTEDLVGMLDESFLSRWLVYYQTDEHVELIRRSKDTDLQILEHKIETNDWISLLDYLHTFDAEYDMDKVEKIWESVIPALSEDLRKHYDARHMHHIECLIDGIVKTRCLFDHNMSFAATEKDYEVLDEMWGKIIGSWIDAEMIKNLPVEKRKHYLPENSQWFYEEICKQKRHLSRVETEQLVEGELSKAEYIAAFMILRDNGLIIEHDGLIRPYWMGELVEDE